MTSETPGTDSGTTDGRGLVPEHVAMPIPGTEQGDAKPYSPGRNTGPHGSEGPSARSWIDYTRGAHCHLRDQDGEPMA